MWRIMQCENLDLKIIKETLKLKYNMDSRLIKHLYQMDIQLIEEAAERMAERISELEESNKNLVAIDDNRLKIEKKLREEIDERRAESCELSKSLLDYCITISKLKADLGNRPEVIRCKQCKFSYCLSNGTLKCRKTNTHTFHDGYCYKAQRDRSHLKATDKMTPELLAKLKKMALNDQPGFVLNVTPEEMDYIHKIVKEEGFFSFGRL